MNWRLGIDLGTNSLGWTVLGLNKKKEPELLVDMGVRIFSDGRDPKTKEPLALGRRTARGIRRNIRRRKQRRKKLFLLLQKNGLFPPSKEDAALLKNLDPYQCRVKALDEKLKPEELGRALFHLGVRRGFKSNRKDKPDETINRDDGESKQKKSIELNPQKMKQGDKCVHLAQTLKESGFRTLGEFLLHKQGEMGGMRFVPDRTVFYPTRQLYEEEFQAIRSKQEVFYPDIQWDEIHRGIFFQRPLLPQERGKCQFEITQERTFKAMPCSHKYRILQEVYNLLWYNDKNTASPLTSEQQQALINKLDTTKELTFTQIRKLLCISGRFNLESEFRNSLKGNETAVLLRSKNRFDSQWDDFSLMEQDDIVECLITAIEDEEVLIMLEQLIAEKQITLSEEQKKSILRLSFTSGTTSLCRDLTEKLVYIMQGADPELAGKDTKLFDILNQNQGNKFQFDKALAMLGYNHSDDSVEKFNLLPYYGKILIGSTMGGGKSTLETEPEKKYGKIGNPTVHVALNQTRVVINTLIKAYGKPSQIVIELSRDLKNSKDKKADIIKQMAENKKENERINKKIADAFPSIQYPGRNERLKYKLWEELGKEGVPRCCLYCGKPIGASEVFTKNIEVEHILPFSKTLLGSESNLTVAHAHCNAKKGEKSPYEAFGANPSGYNWQGIMNRVSNLTKNGKPYAAKQNRFLVTAMEQFEKESSFIERQLNDTRYLSKVAKKYLSCLTEENSDVWVVTGAMTKLLRDSWEIDSILKRKIGQSEIVHFGLKDEQIGEYKKNRYDHRHHALDALVISLIDRPMVQQISTLNARRQKGRVEVPQLPFIHSEIVEKVKNITVSFKPDHGVEGKLSKETLLGCIQVEDAISIKDLTEADLLAVKSSHVKDTFNQAILETGSFAKAKQKLQDVFPQIKVFRKIYVDRTDILSLTTEKARSEIIDPVIRANLERYIASRPGQKIEVILRDFCKDTGHKTLRCKTQFQTPIIIKADPKNPLSTKRYLNPKDYFTVIIWEIPAKKEGKKPTYEGQFVRRTEVDKNKKPIAVKPHPAAKRICELYKDDCIEFSENGIWKKAVIKGLNDSHHALDIRPIFATTDIFNWTIATSDVHTVSVCQNSKIFPEKQKEQNLKSVNVLFSDYSARKITVNPIGRVFR